jgi:hypothetical protein
MYQAIMRTFVVLITVGFAAGGIARAALILTLGEPCHFAAHPHASENAGDAHHHHADAAVAHHNHGSSDMSAPAAGCFKCCGVCAASSNFTSVAELSQIVLIGLSISYVFSCDYFEGRNVPIDPGIPKRMA